MGTICPESLKLVKSEVDTYREVFFSGVHPLGKGTISTLDIRERFSSNNH